MKTNLMLTSIGFFYVKNSGGKTIGVDKNIESVLVELSHWNILKRKRSTTCSFIVNGANLEADPLGIVTK